LGSSVSAQFITSSPDLSKCPQPDRPEYAFVGRSNVGKSSLVNMLTGQKMLAKTSSTPGKTQLINHFLINGEWYLVDLPGYGYARKARSLRSQWERVIEQYLQQRPNLMSTFILLDARLPLQLNDRKVINWFGSKQLHFNIVLTKTDKLTAGKLASGMDIIKNAILEDWDELPAFILSSAVKKTGKDEILAFIEKTNLLFDQSAV